MTRRSGDPIAAYFFILDLQVFFIFFKNNLKVKSLNIFKYKIFIYRLCRDTNFFFKNRKSIIELMNELKSFPNFSGLKQNKKKRTIASIGVLNGVQVAPCGVNRINRNSETVKILVFIFRIIKILNKIERGTTVFKSLLVQNLFIFY